MTNDPVTRSDELDRVLTSGGPIAQQVKRLDRWFKWLAISVALDVGLTIAVVVLGFSSAHTADQAKDAVGKATSALAQNQATCRAGNESRRIQRGLWNFVLSFPPPPHESIAQKRLRLEQTAKFKAYIDKAFKPRDCEHLKAKPSRVGPLPSSRTLPPPSARAGQSPDSGGTVASGPRQQPSTQSSTPQPAPTPQHSKSSRPTHPPSQSPTPAASPLRSALCKIAKVCLAAASAAPVDPPDPPWRGLLTILGASLIATVLLAYATFGWRRRGRVVSVVTVPAVVRSADQPSDRSPP